MGIEADPCRQLLADTLRAMAQVEEALAAAKEFAENVARIIIIAAAPTHEALVRLQESPAYDEAIKALLADANAPTPDFS